jgi:predicted ATPase
MGSHILPPPPELIGRDQDITRVLAALADDARILTLWGPGGIGKTSLALGIAYATDPATVVFAAVREEAPPDDVIRTIASALGAHAGRERSLEDALARVGELLAARGKVLVIIDNAETVIATVARFIVALRAVAPHARFLVTSREPLGIAAERVIDVPPLSPETAIRLLERRATARQPAFTASYEALAALVAKTEGIPLAIELCAARLDVFSIDELLERIAVSLDILATRRRDVDARHRTLFASIDVSYRLLDDDERRALAQLTTFAREFSLEGAEAIVDVATPAIDVVSSLLAKSLIARHGARFALYDSVRAFLAKTSPADEAVIRRHTRYVTERAVSAGARIDGNDGFAAIADLVALEADLITIANRSPLAATEPILALGALAEVRGPVASFAALAARVAKEALDDVSIGRIEVALGEAYFLLGDLELARTTLERATQRLAAHGAPVSHIAAARIRLAKVALHLGDYASVEAVLGGLPDSGERQRLLGQAAYRREEPAIGRMEFDASLRLMRAAGDVRGEAYTISRLGYVAYEEGRFDDASSLFAESRAIFERVGDERSRGELIGCLGNVARAKGQYDDAAMRYEEAISILRRAGDRFFEAVFHMDLGITYLLTRRPARALEELARTGAVAAPLNAPLVALISGYRVAALALTGHIDEARALAKTVQPTVSGVTRDCLDAHAQTILAHDRRDEAAAWLVATEGDAPKAEHVRLSRAILRSAIADILPKNGALVIEGERVHVRGRGWVDLSARPALLRIARFLVERRTSHPGEPHPAQAIAAAGWPGEKIKSDAAAIRVRVALAHLRKLGFGEVLLRTRSGWYFDPSGG